MKKDKKIALKAMRGFARYGVQTIKFGNKSMSLKRNGKDVIIKKS